MFGGDSGTIIADVEFDALVSSSGAKFNASAGAAVLHRIVDQVGEDLVDRFAIGQYHWQGFHRAARSLFIYDLQMYSLRAGDFAETLFGIVEEFDGRDGLGLKTGFARFHARQSEQIF